MLPTRRVYQPVGFFHFITIHNGMISLETISPPSAGFVQLATLKAHLNINATSFDDLLTHYLNAAGERMTDATGYAPDTGTYRLALDDWPTDRLIHLPRWPVQSITSVQYRDLAGTWYTMNSSDYLLDATGRRLVLSLLVALPMVSINGPAVRVTFVAGAGASPFYSVKQGTMLLAAHYYRNRGDASVSEPVDFWDLVTTVRGSYPVKEQR